jgi:class 3 adenylate cyclase/tetratricopeptide (TPR) repeat protein
MVFERCQAVKQFFVFVIVVHVVLLLAQPALFAGSSTIDSLRTVLSSTTLADTSRVRALNQLCWTMRYTDYVASLQYGLQGLEHAEKIRFPDGMLEALNFVGVVYRNARLYEQALEYFRRADSEALTQNNVLQRAYALNNIGDVYRNLQQFDSATTYIRGALRLFEQLHDARGIQYSLVRLGETAFERKDTLGAVEFYKQRKRFVEQAQPARLPDAWIALLAAYSTARQDTNVLRALPEALPLLGNTVHERALYTILAKVYNRKGDTARAEEYFLKALDKKTNSQGNVIGGSLEQVAAWLADAAARRGDYKRAYLYRTRAQQAHEDVQKASDMRSIAQAQMTYETTRRREQTAAFAKQQEWQQTVIVGVSVALYLALFFGALLLWTNRLKARDNNRILVINRIGAEIAGSLIFKDVVLRIHNEINKLMDAPIFNIGVYLPDEERIEFRYLIENGEFLDPPSVMMSDTARPAVQCVLERKEIVINDMEIPILVGAQPKSLVYVPLIASDRVIGVFSVQSLYKNSYTKNSVALLRAISSHIATAMENVHAYELLQSQSMVLAFEREKSEQLLLNILPPTIAERMKNSPGKIAERFDAVSVMFVDIVGFTTFSRNISAEVLVEMLDSMFSEFDRIMQRYGLEKIKTIGDAYMAASGIPTQRADHAEAIARAALDIIALEGNRVRIGIHTGAVVAGVIGTSKFAYDLWGDTVNTASRMESCGEPGKIHVSPEVYAALKDTFTFEERGEIDVKGTGLMRTWFLVGGA